MFGNTVRGGLVLAALASGCDEHHRGPTDDGGADARAMLDAGAFDAGSLLDAGRDTSSDAGAGDGVLRAALRAVCMKLNECDPTEVPDVEACVDTYIESYGSLTPDCVDAFSSYLECAYATECSVLMDEAMFDANLMSNCSDEVTATMAACPDL